MGYRVAVVGATGNVGREMLNILAERKFPATEVIALASSRSIRARKSALATSASRRRTSRISTSPASISR